MMFLFPFTAIRLSFLAMIACLVIAAIGLGFVLFAAAGSLAALYGTIEQRFRSGGHHGIR